MWRTTLALVPRVLPRNARTRGSSLACTAYRRRDEAGASGKCVPRVDLGNEISSRSAHTCYSLLLVLLATAWAAANEPIPQWISTEDTSAFATSTQRLAQGRTVTRSFEIIRPVLSATLQLAGDFCAATASINGQGVAATEAYGPKIEVDATQSLRLGQNNLAIRIAPTFGPTAVAMRLVIVFADGSRQVVVTDNEWQNSPPGGFAALGEIEPALFGIGRRPPTVDPFDNYEQWRQATGAPASAAAFWTAPGFEIALVRAAQPDESSWVSLAFDPAGRATIAREDKGLLRMTLAADRRSIEKVETIDSTLEECRGLLYAHGALYASANNSKGLYRLRDKDGDGQFDDTKLLRQLPGNVGHGRNDLALAPDGSIHWICGDSVDLPKENVTDLTSPFREARRGQVSREGFILRTDSDGQSWELVAAGLRNPFGIVFNPAGDAFTYDADAEFDMGTPWYRPTRVLQLTSGCDFGWRGVTGKWPPYFPNHADNALPTLDIGRGSPTAVMFGTRLQFPAEYRRALLILDWTYGRILAVHLLPRGAGYLASAETLLKGRPLNVTDLAAGPDGALYLVTGGRKTQSALYRIAFTGEMPPERSLSSHEAACRKQADAARDLRLLLEWHHRPNSLGAVECAWPHLDSPDPRLRYAARIAVEHQPVDSWRERALADERSLAAPTALVALARSGNAADIERVLARLQGMVLRRYDERLILQAFSLCRQNAPKVVAARGEQIREQLRRFLPGDPLTMPTVGPAGSAAELRRDRFRLLSEFGAPQIIEPTLNTLLASSAQEDRLVALFALRNVREGWTKETRKTYFTALRDASKFVAGEGMPKFLSQIREEAVATLSEAEKRELASLLDPSAEIEEPLPPTRPLVRKWKAEDFAELLRDSQRTGNAEKGAVVFQGALCARCHRAGARGPAVGPDLTHVGGRFSPRDLLDSILTPNKVVAENYRSVQIRTSDGRTLVGRALLEGDYRSEKLRLSTQPLRPAEFVELDKKQIEEVRESELSPMPEGLLDGFRAEDVLDLLAFLRRGQ